MKARLSLCYRGQDGTGIIFVKGTKQHFDEGV
jgi:hypothetical protein